MVGIKSNEEKFTSRAKSKFGNKYDYSKIRYVNCDTKVSIKCKVHGLFEQTPYIHLKSVTGCSKCSMEQAGVKHRKPFSEFVKEANKVHSGKHTYVEKTYKGLGHKLDIICPIHKKFSQKAMAHLYGYKCPKCATSGKPHTYKEFEEKSHTIHDNKYDYSKVVYVNNKTKILIICPEHKEFWQRPAYHLRGTGCPKCGPRGTDIKNADDLISVFKSMYGSKYDYSKVVYKGMHKKITIICPTHGEFITQPNCHKYGRECIPCKTELKVINNRKCKTENFVTKANKVHSNYYTYEKSIFEHVIKKLEITCPKHGSFWMNPHNHLNKHGCPTCNFSKTELQMIEYFKENDVVYEHQFSKLVNSRTGYCLPFDFYIPSMNLLLEYDGIFHYKQVHQNRDFEKQKLYDRYKNFWARKNKYKLIRISYKENLEERLNEIFQ